MKRYSFLVVVLLITVFLTAGLQCDKGDDLYLKPVWEFSQKLTLYPYKKVYTLKDTIWVEFQTPENKLFDNLSGSMINTDSTYLYARIDYHRYYPSAPVFESFTTVQVVDATDPTLITGPLANENLLMFKTACNKNYLFKVGFVPTKTGIYGLEPAANLSSCPDPAASKSSKFTFTFDLADCNKEFWLSIPSRERAGESGYQGLGIDRKQIFVFKVE